MALFRHVAHGLWNSLAPFSFTLWTTGSDDVATTQGYWHTALGLFWAQATPQYTADVTITESATYLVTEATGLATEKDVDTEALAGTDGAGALLPPQLAIVVSLRTGLLASRGLSGRIYLPATSTTGITDGELNAGATTDLTDGLTAMFNSLKAHQVPVLYQRKTHTTKTLVSYAVGNVLDTQRRRRDSLTETRTTIAI